MIAGMRRETDDVLCLSTPDLVDPNDAERVDQWKRIATGLAKKYVWEQHSTPPFDIEFGEVEILITGDVAELEKFQPGDGCEKCREGTSIAVQHLTAMKERGKGDATVTMVNIHCTEVW